MEEVEIRQEERNTNKQTNNYTKPDYKTNWNMARWRCLNGWMHACCLFAEPTNKTQHHKILQFLKFFSFFCILERVPNSVFFPKFLFVVV